MEKLRGRDLHRQAKDALKHAKFPPRRFVLWFALGLILTNCLLSLLSIGVDLMTENMSTLASLKTRNLLYSLDTTLSLAFSVAQLFWNYSMTVFALKVSRNEDYSLDTLWDGFRLWKRALGATFWPGLRILGMYFLMGFGLILLYLVGSDFLLAVGSLALVIGLVVYAYGFWMVPYLALDNLAIPTVALPVMSRRAMAGRKWQIFLVQLRFLWFTLLWSLLQLLPDLYSLSKVTDFSALLADPTLALPSLSLRAQLVFLAVQTLGLFLLSLWKQGEISTTYACAYNKILEDRMDIAPAQPEN